jgi:hypothetical protein
MKRRTFVLAVVVSVAAAACGVKDRTEAKLELADARLTVEQADGARHELALTAAGAVTWDGKPQVTISRQGVVRAGKQVLAKIDKYGAVTVGGQPTNLVVTREGALVLDGVNELTIDRDGVVGGGFIATMDHPAVKLGDGSKLAYVGPPAARQALLLGFATVVIDSLSPAAAPASK